MSINTKTGRPNAAVREGIADRILDLRSRIYDPMVTYKEQATGDVPQVLTALDDVLAYMNECDQVGITPHSADVLSLVAAALGVTS